MAHVHAMGHIWNSEHNFWSHCFPPCWGRASFSFLLHQLAHNLLSNSPDSTSHVTKYQDYRCTHLACSPIPGSVSGHDLHSKPLYLLSHLIGSIVLFCFVLRQNLTVYLWLSWISQGQACPGLKRGPPAFYVQLLLHGCWDLNFGPHDWAASTLNH